MSKLASATIGICLGALALNACGESKGDGKQGEQPIGAPDETEFSAQFAQRFCQLTEQCCELSGGVYGADCLAAEEVRQNERAESAKAVGATFDATRAAECLAQLSHADCALDEIGVLRELLPACEVWRGHTAPGGACESPVACDDSMANVAATCSGGSCTVALRLQPGMPCTPDDRFNRCDQLTATCDEDALECLALPGPGDACLDDCRAGSSCDVDQGVCIALSPVGEPCVNTNDCASDVCSAGQCASILAGDDYCELP